MPTTLSSVHSCLEGPLRRRGTPGLKEPREEKPLARVSGPQVLKRGGLPPQSGRYRGPGQLAGQTGISGAPPASPGPTHVLEAAHEVVADRRARQVGRVGAAPNVEEVVRAQHSVVLLRVACGGQDPVHRDGHLPSPGREGERQGDNWHQLPGKSHGQDKGGAGGQWGEGLSIFMSACLGGGTVGVWRRRKEAAQDLMVSGRAEAGPTAPSADRGLKGARGVHCA